MYLKEIQTYGFKSFADKLSFEFTNNLNGIVGPNGSGKSNIVDAVRWVLGEQSNKSLRAQDATSVIFSGSKSRKPLNSAMVNIVFDNTDRHLPIDFNEVSIKRILYRSGENEYYLNGEKCRLKDITELLTDSGTAKESFNIIGQGKIDEILSTKPTDRRIIFEEAAGVLKYKKRKEEAIRKLERTNTNINRVNDIIKELETNLEPLRKQSEDAKKYLSCKELLTNYDISLIIHDIDEYSNELKIKEKKITELTDKITELNNNNSSYDINILNIKNNINKIEIDLANHQENILLKTKELEQTQSDILLLKERKKYITTDSTIEKINNLNEQILSLKDNLSSISSNITINNEKISNYESTLKINLDKLNTLKKELSKYNNQYSSNNRSITDINYKITYLEETINNGNNLPTSIKNLINNPLFSGVHGTIGSLLNIDNQYSLAVSTHLGGATNYLVVDDRKLASRMVEYLKSNKLGRATFFPLDVIRPRYIDPETKSKLEYVEGYLNTLDKVVKYKEKYSGIILNQLGNVILVDNINNANKISNIIANKYKIVTLDGQVVNVGGSITGGENIKTSNIIKDRYDLQEYKIKLTNLSNSNQELLENITNVTKEIEELENRIATYNGEKAICLSLKDNYELSYNSLNEEITNLTKELEDIKSITNNKSQDEEQLQNEKYYHIKSELSNLTKELELLKIEKIKLTNDLFEIETNSKNSNIYINKLEQNLKDFELQNSRLEIKIDNLLNNLNEDYSITYNEAKEKYILDNDPEEVRKEVSNLKNTLKNFGMINLGAIEEYERINTRYTFLTKQKEDLSNAENTLLEIINDMDSIMKEKFITTFNEIKVEFKRVFKELFKGGEADIYLTNPDNILETGIELTATPPGKKLTNIQSLSGGEKTFTAISLLFAILNVRPVPFCLFDEVEAALDDANVDAFGEYLNKYRNITQFIIITHKKKTMEFIDTLYGITMQESGVSKRVSVKLNDIKSAN